MSRFQDLNAYGLDIEEKLINLLSKELATEIDKNLINEMNYYLYLEKKNFYEELGYIKYKGRIHKFPGDSFINDEYIYCGGVPLKLEDLEDITKNEVRQLKLNRIL